MGSPSARGAEHARPALHKEHGLGGSSGSLLDPSSAQLSSTATSLRQRSATTTSLAGADRAQLDRSASFATHAQTHNAGGPSGVPRRRRPDKDREQQRAGSLHGGASADSQQKSPVGATRRILEHLLHLWQLTRRVWFQLVQPAAFCLTGYWRRGTALGAVYTLGSLLLLGLTGLTGPRKRWRRYAYSSLALLCLLILVVGITLRVLCACSALDDFDLHGLAYVGIGGVGQDIRPYYVHQTNSTLDSAWLLDDTPETCRNPLKLLPEATATAAGIVGMVLSCVQERHRTQGGEGFSSKDGRRGLAPILGLLLLASASVLCNIFSTIYLLGACVLLLAVQKGDLSSLDRVVGTAQFRHTLMFAIAFNICTVNAFASPALAYWLPTHIIRLLGVVASDPGAVFLQGCSSFLALECLSLMASLGPPKTIRIDRIDEGSPGQVLDLDQLDRMDSPSSGALRSPRAAPTSTPTPTPNRDGLDSLSQHRAGSAAGSLSPSPMASSLSSNTHQFERVDSLQSRGTARTARTARTLRTRRDRPPRSTSAPGATVVAAAQQTVSKLDRFFRGSLALPLFSSLLWAMVWPSAATLPLLLGGILLLYYENSRFPIWLFRLALAYQLVVGLANYGYNVYCTAYSVEMSNIPVSFSWEEKVGLQSYNRNGNASAIAAHVWYVLVQASAVASLAVAVGARSAGITHGSLWKANSFAVLTRNIVAWARPLTVILVLALALSDMSFSLLGLGYILWILALVVRGCTIPYQRSGWDLLRGSIGLWTGLLMYSNAILVTLFCWQVLSDKDQPLVGLFRNARSLAYTAWPHLLIAALCSIQVRASRNKVLEPVYFLVSTSTLGWLTWVGGIFCHITLLFVVAMVPPKTLDSGLFLLLYVITVALEQWDPTTKWRLRVLAATAWMAGILTPLRYAVLLQPVQEILHQTLPKTALKQNGLVWDTLAVLDVDEMQMKFKLFLFVLLVITSATLRRMFMNPHVLDTARTEIVTRRGAPGYTRFVREGARWSMSILMFVAYFLMRKDDAASVIQVGVLLALLIKGRRWEVAGALISGMSMIMLLLQFWFDLKYVRLSQDQKEYFGLLWEWSAVKLEVTLLFLGILQRSVQRAAAHLCSPQESRGRTSYIRQHVRSELAAYGAHIGAVLLLILAMFRSSAWSLIYIACVVTFRLSGASSRGLAPARTNAWLRLMAMMQGLCLLYSIVGEVWLPSGLLLDKPTPAWVAASRACDFVSGSNATARAVTAVECGDSWLSWLDIEEAGKNGPRYHTWSFISLFLTCLLRHLCVREIDGRKADEGKAGTASPTSTSRSEPGSTPPDQRGTISSSARSGVSSHSGRHNAVLLGSDAPGVRLPEANPSPTSPPAATCDTGASRSSFDMAKSSAASGTSPALGRWRAKIQAVTRVARTSPTGASSSHHRNSVVPHLAHGSGAILLWLSLGFAALSQTQTSLITLGYLLLLFIHLITSESTQTLQDPFAARARVIGHILNFNIFVCAVIVLFQCPILPCPFEDPESSIAVSSSSWWPSEAFTTPARCAELQEQSDAYGGCPYNVIMQCIGLHKIKEGVTFEWSGFWNMMVFLAAVAQTLVSSRWDNELKAALAHQGRQFAAREERYTRHLLTWRRWELNRVDLRHQVLLRKLDRLIQYLNTVRAVWSNERDQILPEEKEEHNQQTRLFDLCLRSGSPEDEVRLVLSEFEEDTSDMMTDDLALEAQQRIAKIIDDCVCDRLERLGKLRLHAISASEDAESAAELLRRCRNDIGAALADANKKQEEEEDTLEEEEKESQELAAVREEAMEEGHAGQKPESPPALGTKNPKNSGAPGPIGTENPRNSGSTGPIGTEKSRNSGSPGPLGTKPSGTMGEPDVEAKPSIGERVHEVTEALIIMVKAPMRRLYEMVINDFLFMREGDDTLARHRRSDGLLMLLAKALLSQTFLFLIIAAIIQFVVSMSIFASVTVSAILLSLMVFPHVPPAFWKGLQVYNVSVILIKMVYQLPNITAPSPSSAVPWQAVLGLLKVVPGRSEESYLECSSLAEALWADLLVCGALFCHWHALRQSGHLGDPGAVCQKIQEDDEMQSEIPGWAHDSTPRGIRSRSEQRSRALPNLEETSLHELSLNETRAGGAGEDAGPLRASQRAASISAPAGLGQPVTPTGPSAISIIMDSHARNLSPVVSEGHSPRTALDPIQRLGLSPPAQAAGSRHPSSSKSSPPAPVQQHEQQQQQQQQQEQQQEQQQRQEPPQENRQASGIEHRSPLQLSRQPPQLPVGGQQDDDDGLGLDFDYNAEEVIEDCDGDFSPRSDPFWDDDEYQAREAFTLTACAERAKDVLTKMTVGGSGIRKPAMDLYNARLGLSIAIFLIVFFGWNSLTETQRSIYESVTNSVFSGQQVVVVTLVLALIIENRAEYTWYTQERVQPSSKSPRASLDQTGSFGSSSISSLNEGVPNRPHPSPLVEAPRAGVVHLGGASYQSTGMEQLNSYNSAGKASVASAHVMANFSSLVRGSSSSRPSVARLVIPILQKVMLLLQLIVIHVLFIRMWVMQDLDRRSPQMLGNFIQMLLYVVYIAYLALTSLQLKYDVHVIRGGLALTRNTDLLTSLSLKAYGAIPFVEELRVLADWTVTKTSLDFFMWMKLEDAHQNLAVTARDMLVRRMIPRAGPRPGYEKVLQGGCLLLLLLALIVGPIMFFSTLNPSLKSNTVTAVSLKAELFITNPETGEKSSVLYSAGQSKLSTLDESSIADPSDTDGFEVTFPQLAESYWLITQSLRQQMSNVSQQTSSTTSLKISATFDLVSGDSTTAVKATGTLSDTNLVGDELTALQSILDTPTSLSTGNAESVSIADGFKQTVNINSNNQVTVGSTGRNLTLTLEGAEVGELALPYWALRCAGTSPKMTIYTEKVAPSLGTSSTSDSSGLGGSGVLAIYFTVVYTIGRFLRLVFQDSSKRMIYEELPDTSLLLDLCNGIYIARIQGFLEMEYKLYYQLVQIYRSPELLLDVSRSPDYHFMPNGPNDEETATIPKRPPGAGPGAKKASTAAAADDGRPRGRLGWRSSRSSSAGSGRGMNLRRSRQGGTLQL